MGTEKHGGYKSHRKTYRCWQDMKQRCLNPKSGRFYCYGARGIKVCDRWMSFKNFFADMGERPDGQSIERIDNNGNYEPSNCKWASMSEQANNKSFCKLISFNGETLNVTQWAKKIGRHPTTVDARIKQGYPLDMVLSPQKLLFGNRKATQALKASNEAE